MYRGMLDGIELDDEVRGTEVALREWSFGRDDGGTIISLVHRNVLFGSHALEQP